MLRWSCSLRKLLRHTTMWWFCELFVCSDGLLLLANALESSLPASGSMSTTFLTYHWYSSCIDWLAECPIAISTLVHALVSIQVANEIALILLGTNNSLLCSHLASSMHQLVISSMLR